MCNYSTNRPINRKGEYFIMIYVNVLLTKAANDNTDAIGA
jgi:hypothetical protein